jgi:hypothetical protein
MNVALAAATQWLFNFVVAQGERYNYCSSPYLRFPFFVGAYLLLSFAITKY